MYEKFYGLRKSPFTLLPSPEFLFLSSTHRNAVALLDYGVRVHGGLTVITGEVGTGKTTLIRNLLRTLDTDRYVLGQVTNAQKSLDSLLHWVMSAFGLESVGDRDVEMHQSFRSFLMNNHALGKRTILIIDEAQNLSRTALEEVRMMTNVNVDDAQMLQLILVGQPELLDVLRSSDLRQFVQRISQSYNLSPLSFFETADYIRHRLAVAGESAEIFDDMACGGVHHFSKGVPRLINTLCDSALVYGYADEIRHISLEIVCHVVRDKARSGVTPIEGVW